MKRDPVEARSDGSHDLYDVSTWEPRTLLDRLSVKTYHGVLSVARIVFILVALLIIGAQVLLGTIGVVFSNQPEVVGLVALSVLPALALVAYVYQADIGTSEPLKLVVGTFVLGVLFAGFAAYINSAFGPFLQAIPIVGFALFFYLVVAPVEETVKLLAVRLYPYRSSKFDSVIDGAVYGAAAGLGFATIENALYISRGVSMDGGNSANAMLWLTSVPMQTGGAEGIIGAGAGITALRALAGPGHVIYSAFAGYYLGLAKFNQERAGPIVVKGLLIAALIHATYNTLVGIVPTVATALFGVPQLVAFFGFVVVFDGVFGYILYRKLKRYRKAYRTVHDGVDESSLRSEMTEFDG
jgi:RsiW-degrading membrane proteinase PrsW (M82 family)